MCFNRRNSLGFDFKHEGYWSFGRRDKTNDKINLHAELRYGFRTFQTVSKMRAMTPEMKLCKILDLSVKVKTDDSNFRQLSVKMRC